MIEREIFRKIFGFIAIAVMISIPTSCIKDDDDDDCGIYLEFIYDHNMEYVNSFDPQVDAVEVLLFDSEGLYMFSKSSLRKDLVDGKKMFLENNIPFGSYQILTIGNLSDKFRISDADGNDCIAGETNIEDVRIALRRESKVVSHEFPPLWMGKVISIDYKADLSVWQVYLVKNTNRFNMILSESGTNGDRVLETDVRYTFEISTPEGAVYGHDNMPKVREVVGYMPYYLAPGNEEDEVCVGKINTMRLIYDEGYDYSLIVRNTQTLEVLWEYDLMRLIKETKPDKRPDGTLLPLQEYLDRQSEWNFIILYKEVEPGEDPDGFVAVAIKINGWIIWLHDIEL